MYRIGRHLEHNRYVDGELAHLDLWDFIPHTANIYLT